MIFNLVCVFSHSGSHCAKITIIQHLSWLHWISAEQNNELTARWWCSRIHMSREWALYGQVGVRLCRSLATGGVSEGAWLTHMEANLLLVLVLCCCLGMLLQMSPQRAAWLSALSPARRQRRGVLFCAMLHAATALPPDGSWREAWLSYLYIHQQWPYMENKHRVTNAGPL